MVRRRDSRACDTSDSCRNRRSPARWRGPRFSCCRRATNHSACCRWNARFLRGSVADLLDRDHDVRVLEPDDGWSRSNLVRQYGRAALDQFRTAYPRLVCETYSAASIELDDVLAGADLVLVHEWNDPD